jgi:hypothetical protein
LGQHFFPRKPHFLKVSREENAGGMIVKKEKKYKNPLQSRNLLLWGFHSGLLLFVCLDNLIFGGFLILPQSDLRD